MNDSPGAQAAQAYQSALRMLDKKYTTSYTRWNLAARFSLLRPEEISEIVSDAERNHEREVDAMNLKSAYDQALDLLRQGCSKEYTRWVVQADNKLLTADEVSETVERAAKQKHLQDCSAARNAASDWRSTGCSAADIYKSLGYLYPSIPKKYLAEIAGVTEIERAREDATVQFTRGESPSRIYNWLCKYYTDLSKETITQIVGYTPPVEPVEPDYLLKVAKQPDGWYVYTPKYSGPFIFTESNQLTAFVNDYLSFDAAKAEKLSNLKRELDALEAEKTVSVSKLKCEINELEKQIKGRET